MMEHVDYHVGLLRGFVLAHNAPSIILHALDVLLENPRSRAGEVIGGHGDEIKIPPGLPVVVNDAAKFVAPQPEPLERPERTFFWSPNDNARLKEMYERGDKLSSIAEALNRTKASCQTRISAHGLKRKEYA